MKFFYPQEILIDYMEKNNRSIGINNPEFRIFENLRKKQHEALYLLDKIYNDSSSIEYELKTTIVESMIVKLGSMIDLSKLIYSKTYLQALLDLDANEHKNVSYIFKNKNIKNGKEIDYLRLCRAHINDLSKDNDYKFLEKNKDFFKNFRGIRNRLVHGGANILIFETKSVDFDVLDYKRDSYIDYSSLYFNALSESLLTVNAFKFFSYYFSLINFYCLDLFMLLIERLNQKGLKSYDLSLEQVEVKYDFKESDFDLSTKKYSDILQQAESYKECLYDRDKNLLRTVVELPDRKLMTDVKDNYQEIIIKSICDSSSLTYNINILADKIELNVLRNMEYDHHWEGLPMKFINNKLSLIKSSPNSEKTHIIYTFDQNPLINVFGT
ncbi:hypothetical protein [Acinetobacter silvestris]|uniref:Uncharacterized protein n=1 Tax=Acinetobacter silvestris TaxID=1977882 RepID=A0A1Y3CH11_9GAMM|nr:hypothetical protein [Acinetobacter silvestris]OTG66417.1 hypothetical protein B9T28_03945 [Acinetobacter silvestris]